MFVYSVTGVGAAKLKEGINVEELETILHDARLKNKQKLVDFEFDISDGEITLNDLSRNFDENATLEFLNVLCPYITQGYMNYSADEDGETWCYDVAHGEWMDPRENPLALVAELSRQGYMVELSVTTHNKK